MTDLIRDLRDTLGGVEVPELMHGDNLAILLCGIYEDDDDDVNENGWTNAAIAGQDKVLDAIHAHYQPTIEALTADKKFIIEERDRTFALMLSRAEAAEAERDRWIAHAKNAVWADSEELKHAEAEVARLREALEDIVADCEAAYAPSHGAIKYAAKLALKGESHE